MTADEPGPRGSAAWKAILVCAFAVVLLRTAWLCDDAFILFRTVDNFLNGHGLRWNPLERVQSFTCPLWLFVLAGASRVTGEIPLTATWVSVACSLVAFALVLRSAPPVGAACLGVLLILSKSFVEYSTSGLENPLTHLLLAAFLLTTTGSERHDPRSLLAPAALAALCALNRQDTLLLFAPLLAWRWYRTEGGAAGRARGLLWMAAAALPLAAWEAFSLVYYGSFVPNTALAKLGLDVSGPELARQGVVYLGSSVDLDPITPLVLAAGLVRAGLRREARSVALAVGVLLYVAYVVRIGGDFMSGRHLAAPFLIAAHLLGRGLSRASAPTWIALAAAVVLGALNRHGPLRTDGDFGMESYYDAELDESGVGDERRVYYPFTGLLSSFRSFAAPIELPEARDAFRAPPGTVVLGKSVGGQGFYGGPDLHVVDVYALSDPLLARIPRVRRTWVRDGELTWRIGHFERAVPAGYVESLRSGENCIEDPDLSAFYDRVVLVTRAPLFAPGRWRAIRALLTGADDHLVQAYLERNGP